MRILVLKTDQPEAYLALFDDHDKIRDVSWQAHRELAETLHTVIETLLHEEQLDWRAIEGIVIYKGPGSFTGLRIGISCANALADSLGVPIVASDGDSWINDGIAALLSGADQKIALPEYGGPAFTTSPRK